MSTPLTAVAPETLAWAHLVGLIYEAATDENAWTEVLRELRSALSCSSAIYERPHDAPELHHLVTTNLDPEFTKTYNQHYNSTNVWATSKLNQAADLVVSDRIIDLCDLERTEFYGDWLAPQKLQHALTARLGADEYSSLNFGLVREGRYGAFTLDEADYLASLLPHLKRSAAIASRSRRLQVEADAALAGYGRLGIAAAIVDERGRVQSANDRARELLGGGRAGAVLNRRDRAGHFLPPLERAACSPLEHAVVSVSRDGEAATLVMIRTSEPAATINEDSLRRTYNFTPAEAKLARALCEGRTLAEHARSAQIKLSTVKTHLASLFRKTDVSRQTDLVRLLVARTPLAE